VTPRGEEPEVGEVKVNGPLRTGGTDIFLLGNGYAPSITVTSPDGSDVFSDSVPFLPQDANLTSLGVVKVPDGLAEQVGMIGFFYPTQETATSGAFFSSYPDLVYPMLTLNVYTGDLGLDEGVPTSVYSLLVDDMTQLTGGDTGVETLELRPGETRDLPNGLGSVTFNNADPTAAADDLSHSVPRFASFDIHHDPTQLWVLTFAVLVLLGLLTGLLVPRRRVWVKAAQQTDGSLTLEYAGLARGEDPALESAVTALADRHLAALPGLGTAATGADAAKPGRPAVSTPDQN
jgi:cytochrome c biogenesis protein